MRIAYDYKDGVLGCCALQVYAILGTESFTALKDDGAGNKSLNTYDAGSNEDFALVLAEHAEFSKHYYLDIPDGDLDLPATPAGEYYRLEFWLAAVAGTYDREVDTLLHTEKFIWDGSDYAETWTPSTEGEVHIGVAYDSVTHTSYFMASLSKNGLHVTNPTGCSFKLISETDAVLVESDPGTQLANAPGVFVWSEPGQNPTADRVYAIHVTITHNGVEYTGVNYQINWD